MGSPILQRTFAAGELAPVLHARADQTKYLGGLRTCLNFLVRREGGVTTRPGLRYIDSCKTTAAGTRLFAYVDSEVGGSVLVEAGDHYFRFFTDPGDGWGAVDVSSVAAYDAGTTYEPGDLVRDGGVNYYVTTETVGVEPPNASFFYAMPGALLEVPTPYGVADLFKWNQSGNVVTLTHHGYAPRELIFESLTHWVLRAIATGPGVAAPSGGAGTPGAAGTLPYSYVITAQAANTFEEGPASAPIAVTGAAPTALAPNVLTWTAQPEAGAFNVYLDPYGNGVYGFVGTAAAATFSDAGLVPDFDTTPPIARVLFAATGDYPECSGVFQQRRFFANTSSVPDGVDGSRIGFPSNFGISSPLQDDDALTFRIAGNNHNPVRYMVALKAGLVLMTDGGEWTVNGSVPGAGLAPLTPSSIVAEQETYVGIAQTVPPVIVGKNVLYTQARGSIVRELNFDQVEGLGGKDLTIWATHLFEGHTVRAMAFQQVPDSIIWCVRSDGVLLGLTYIPEQDVWGWHRHTTGASGVIEDACVMPGRREDELFVIVRRIINAIEVRYIEKLETRQIVAFNAQAFLVDAGLSYSGTPASSFSGLDHLEGQVVAIVGDGAVIFDGDPASADAADFTVTGGEVILSASYSDVHIGLAYLDKEVETLDVDVQGSAIRDKQKTVHGVTLLVDKSARGFYAGPDVDSLTQYVPQTWETAGAQTTGQLELAIKTDYNVYGRVLVQQRDPLPLTIIGLVPNVELGG